MFATAEQHFGTECQAPMLLSWEHAFPLSITDYDHCQATLLVTPSERPKPPMPNGAEGWEPHERGSQISGGG